MELLQKISDKFWSENVWLPPNTTWEDIGPYSKIHQHHTDYRHLYIYPIPMALVMLVIRFLIEKYFFSPIGRALGIKSIKAKPPVPNQDLELTYSKQKSLNHKQLVSLAKQLDLSERQIERWWRRRRAQDKPTTLVKFCENSWRCLYYTYSFFFGLFILWDKTWLWDIKHCWYGFPHQPLDNDVWWYYMISMAFYWSLTFSQFFDVKRKDFWQMFIHHVLTLTLMAFSWICNLHRVGALVLLVHDCADIFLEAAKVTKYAQFQKLCDAIFFVFTIVWVITRLGLYPRVIYSSSIEAPAILKMMFPAYYIFNTLLILLLVLHIAWTILIMKIAINTIKAGQMEGDMRSSSDEISDSSENARPLTNGTPKKELIQNNRSPRKTK